MNNYKLKEIKVTEFDPYREDLLDRKKTGDILLQLIQTSSKGFVMALNGKWGSGKTTFVNMWHQQMKDEGYKTIYYNVWENDYISDPLIGLIAEFNEQTQVPGEKTLTDFLKKASIVGFSMIPALAGSIAKTYLGADIEKVVTDASKEVKNILGESVNNYVEQQKHIKSFRKALIEYAEQVSPDKLIIFIIDELDRCKPDFAVKTLERIKHLFSVENIVFVLVIDRVQLGNSIKGYYGSDLIDADDYLRRFIDVPYDLPFRPSKNLIKNVFERFGLDKIILAEEEQGEEKYESLQEFVTMMFQTKQLTIRQLEKWILHTRLIINNEFIKEYVSYKTIAFIVYLYYFDSYFYNSLLINDSNDSSANDLFNRLVQYFHYYQTGVVKDPSHNEVYDVIFEILKMSGIESESIIDQKGKIMLPSNILEVDEAVVLDSFNKIKDKEIAPMGAINYSICEYNCLNE